MKQFVSLFVAIGIFVAFESAVFATEKKAAEPKEVKQASSKVRQATGEVTAVDDKANTLTVKSKKKGDVTCSAAAETKFEHIAGLADIKIGDKAELKYVEIDGKNSCKSIELKTAEKKEAKK